LDCSSATNVLCGTLLQNQTNSSGVNNVSVYCSPNKQPSGSTLNLPAGAGCTGRERIYRFVPTSSGEVEINLTNILPNQDLQLFLFSSCSQFNCLQSSTNTAGRDENIKFNAQAGVTYFIVVDGYRGSTSTYNLSINCCEVVYKSCPEVDFKHYYSGNGSDLKFTFTTNINKAPNEPWKVLTPNGVDIGSIIGNSNNFEFNFPSQGNYEICIPLIDQNGCLYYCCYKVFISNPFDCNLLNFRFNDVNETYEITSSTTGGQLFEHNAGQQPFAVSNVINRPPNNNNCIRTYFYWYQINGVYRLCYIRINICDPFDCGDQNIKYDFNEQTDKFDFTLLEGSKYTNIKWTAKEEISTEIGNTPSVSFYPIGRDCRVYTISVSYYDPATRTFRICCIRVFLCNPFNCNPLNLSYDEEKNEYTFGISGSDVTNFDWVLKPNNLSLGNQQSVTFKPSVGFPCNTYTVSVKYRVGNSWRFCCWKVRICNPKDCGSLISHTYNNGQLNLTTNQNYQQVSWLLNGNKIQNPSNVNPGTYRVCLIYFDPATKAYFVCCKEVTLVSVPLRSISIIISKEICGPKDVEIKVPVKVSDYKDIAGLQFTIASANNDIAEILGVIDINPNSGLANIDFALINKKVLLFYADASKTLPDSTILFNLRVLLKGNVGQTTNLIFEGGLLALNDNGEKLNVIGQNGSVCILNASSSITGSIKSTNDKELKNINVNLSAINTIVKNTQTNNLGIYSINDLQNGNNYTLTPSHTDPIANGIDISDLFLLRRHMQGVSLFTIHIPMLPQI
jgi:hypothetical protein